jgi:hypothetical protein
MYRRSSKPDSFDLFGFVESDCEGNYDVGRGEFLIIFFICVCMCACVKRGGEEAWWLVNIFY